MSVRITADHATFPPSRCISLSPRQIVVTIEKGEAEAALRLRAVAALARSSPSDQPNPTVDTALHRCESGMPRRRSAMEAAKMQLSVEAPAIPPQPRRYLSSGRAR